MKKWLTGINKYYNDEDAVIREQDVDENWTFNPHIDVFSDETEILSQVRDPVRGENIMYIDDAFYDEEIEEKDFLDYCKIMDNKGVEI